MSEKAPSSSEIMIKGALIHNPVLMQCAGLCPVIAAATSLKSAAMFSAAVCVVTLVTCAAASLLLKKLPRWFRMPLYLIIGLAVVCPVLYFIETRTLISINLMTKIYLPLMAVNSVTAVHCEQFSVKNKIGPAFYDAAAVSIGSSAVLLICGALRELLGSSSIAGIHIDLPLTFRSALMPFGALIILGFLAAGLKFLNAFRYPELVPDSESIVVRRRESNEGSDEVEVFDEFWNEKPEESELSIDDYDELFNSLESIFDEGTEEDKK